MKQLGSEAEAAFYEQTWDLSYRHALGGTVQAFFKGLAEGRLLGRACPKCERVLVPPRAFCDRCYVNTEEWREVGPEGTIEMFTVVYEPFRGLPEPPYALAYVRPANADTALLGYVHNVPLEDVAVATRTLAIGTQVMTRFATQPTGTALDYWFEPVSETTSSEA